MKVKILNKIILKNIPSASAIDIFEDKIYIIGDDSPYLYILDKQYNLLDKIQIYQTDQFTTGRIPKDMKYDLECSTIVKYNDEDFMIISGSGSNDHRNNMYLFNLKTQTIEHYSAKPLYSLFLDIYESGESINVEALCSDSRYIYFFNRGGKTEKNVVLRMEISHLFEYFYTKNIVDFTYMLYLCDLPDINNISSGFSGAGVFEDKLFFTSSVEDTDNAIDDGEVLGSFVGIIDYKNKFEITEYCLIDSSDHDCVLKVESVSILSKESNKYNAILVTDDDNGGSDLIEAIIEI